MLLTSNSADYIFNKNQLTEIFISGFKQEEAIGVESEEILVYENTNKAIEYSTAVQILENFDENIWQKIYDNENVIGLRSEDGVISLEPGSQIEISLKPYKRIDDITEKLALFYKELSAYAGKFGAKVLDMGIQPVSSYEYINIIPKKRYEFMTKYLPEKGLKPFIMMRETAGIQANFDYKNEEDAIKKLSLAMKLSPVISSLYANSPIRNGILSGYKSFRANSWLNVDEERCGFISKKLFEQPCDFSFEDYVEVLLDVPMIFIQKGNIYMQTSETFRSFMQNGYKGLKAQISDWENHLSLYFPDVRLKSYIEIRNHDAQNAQMTFSVPAFWKGIMYNQDAMDEVNLILSEYNYDDYMNLRKDSPVYALKSKLGDTEISDLVKEIFDISYFSLKQNNLDEEKYIEPAMEYIKDKRVPADDIIDKYNSL